MVIFRSLALLLVCASLSAAADGSAKLRTLSGKEVQGEMVRIDDKQIVIKVKDAEVKVPLVEVLDVEFQPGEVPRGVPSGTKYIDVELVDGSVLHCGQFTLKKQEVELKLLAGQDVKLPLSSIATVVNDAQDKDQRAEWKRLLGRQGNRDLVVVKKEGTLNGLEGTLGNGDAQGLTIAFELRGSDTKEPIRLERVYGLSFFRALSGNRAETLCKVSDTSGNTFVVAKIAPSAAGYVVTTVAGVNVEQPVALLTKLDFSKGKLTYLSDLEPARKIESSALEGTDHYRRDKNLDGGALRLGGVTYAKGLAVPATTELVYDIGGDYKEFKALLGFDEQVGGDSNVKVLIEGDGRELFKMEIRRGTKKTQPVVVDVKNVKNLRIVVSSLDLLDLGYHVNFADAKVSK